MSVRLSDSDMCWRPLQSEPFSVENNLATPSMKLKRPQLLKRYQTDVDAMYRDLKAKLAARG
jgi:long-chain acyl-CoA synthetase